MKVKIDCDDPRPVYYFSDTEWALEAEVDSQTVERWKRVIEEYDKVQEEMEKAVGDFKND